VKRVLLVALVALAVAAPAEAVRFQPVARGFDAPVYVTAPASEPARLYVVEQAGTIEVLEGGRRAGTFLDIRELVQSGGEQGLLSMAFHPAYPRNPRFYVDYTDRSGDTRVVEYRASGGRAVPGSARQLLFVEQPYANHNGGQVQFGPDGKLYVGMGDGGSGGDPHDYGQNLGARLAKLLRIDVATGAVSVAAYGLRNPWRFSFDRANGDLYVADVGQGEWEEINYRRRGAPGIPNYGWAVYEGRARFKDTALNRRGPLVMPVAVYSHAEGCSVTGGYVYRGRAYRSLVGRYFYGDYCSGRIWSLAVRGGKAVGLRREAPVVENLTSFGEDARGELYATAGGTVYRVTP
jgi:glucose/arabinose dehydrogenase